MFKPNIFYLNQTDGTPYLTLPSPKGNTILMKGIDFTVGLYMKVCHGKVLCSVQQARIKPIEIINEKSSYLPCQFLFTMNYTF